MLDQDLSVHDGGGETGGRLAESSSATRQVVDQLGEIGCESTQVEDVEIGCHTLGHDPAVGEAPRGRRHLGHPVHGILDGDGADIANPVPEQMRLERRIHDLADMRARVAEGRDGEGLAKQFEHHVLIVVGRGLDEEQVEVGVESKIEEDVDGAWPEAAARARSRCRAGGRR